jgi:hypothetical protein
VIKEAPLVFIATCGPAPAGSIWLAVILHFVVNGVVAVQGLTTPMVELGILAYRQLLWFSLPLGVLAIGLLMKTALHPVMPEVP